ncbi:Alpha/Beta hydrolase protein [Stachybotrys elegans]|uniref:Alpha/Beta hydrolase protein n=1 Tax=Stachybotrys elegans TaxID=80388 RepID=A0A8K0WQI7_9HYPO|nr:Alpha/Beta hydrolase protein [Stachybotrys elegans]
MKTSLLLSFQAVFETSARCLAASLEVPSIRNAFMVGGHYAKSASGSAILQHQMYVEHLTPVGGATQPYPIVMIHGAAQTGSNFLTKPDGGPGWSSLFISQGYEVYLVDQPGRGRSPIQTDAGLNIVPPFDVKYVESHFTAPAKYNIWPQARKHTQWNGTGTQGDAVFDQTYAAQVSWVRDPAWAQNATRASGAALLDRIGRPAILLGHSQGGPMPLVIADVRPELTKALILLEPAGPPFQEAVFTNGSARAWGVTDIPMTYDPPVLDPRLELVKQVHPGGGDEVSCILQAESPPPRQLKNLKDIPMLLVTGEASYHVMYDHCTVMYLRQAGCHKLDFLKLWEAGFSGNGHMIFMEMNSDGIQARLDNWIRAI